MAEIHIESTPRELWQLLMNSTFDQGCYKYGGEPIFKLRCEEFSAELGALLSRYDPLVANIVLLSAVEAMLQSFSDRIEAVTLKRGGRE